MSDGPRGPWRLPPGDDHFGRPCPHQKRDCDFNDEGLCQCKRPGPCSLCLQKCHLLVNRSAFTRQNLQDMTRCPMCDTAQTGLMVYKSVCQNPECTAWVYSYGGVLEWVHPSMVMDPKAQEWYRGLDPGQAPTD